MKKLYTLTAKETKFTRVIQNGKVFDSEPNETASYNLENDVFDSTLEYFINECLRSYKRRIKPYLEITNVLCNATDNKEVKMISGNTYIETVIPMPYTREEDEIYNVCRYEVNSVLSKILDDNYNVIEEY